MVKLVDPLTGKTIGKARASANPHLAAKTAFRDNGKIFKQVFRETGSDLVHQCLKKLGLASGS
jgi:NAD+--asparagine ADP-ribosyltransferase